MSGGGQASTTQTQTSTIPQWLQDSAQGYLGSAGQVAQLPFVPYNGQRVADLSPTQQQGIQGLSDLASGTPYMDAAQGQITNTLQGNYSNPYASRGVSIGSNPYLGESPYFQSQLDRGASDILRNYQRGTSADTTRMFNLAGAFGGSAHQTAMANNEHELGNTLANYENQARQGQYQYSGNLAESGLNRDLNAGQFNANLGSSAYENERNRQMGAVSGAQGLYGSQGQAYLNALNGGNTERNQYQQLLDSQYGDFQRWLGYPQQQLDIYGNALGHVIGNSGGQTSTVNQLPPPDRVSQGLGFAALGSMLGRNNTNNANNGNVASGK